MSFITKRERVFAECELFDLPSRNEGKLKAYASCTDARAWSHFGSDKTEHLVDIIKRNNEKCRAKYLPTDVIVDTLMIAKNAEIARLRRNIVDFELMLAAYDQLDLTCEQKCEIAAAHASIKAANKELNEMCLDLDLSTLTEGIDSEGFQTGKSRGDEPKSKNDSNEATKSSPLLTKCTCEVSTSAHDPRINEMQEALINKDAKLGALQNTMAVMENDVCEPYCIYAHIYTASEKIFGILCQNDKYKMYLDLMSSGKDTRCLDIKGKILYKLKLLEKFCHALIAPCSQGYSPTPDDDCVCYPAEIIAHLDTNFTLPKLDSKPIIDNDRAKLVAGIMEHDEMKEIISKESTSAKPHDDLPDDLFGVDNYSIEAENLNRLKNLQADYDELVTCYENMKHERDILQDRCTKLEKAEKEFESLQDQLREYNLLWNEKEHYRKRSADLDTLKEHFLVLSEETSNLETQLKAEVEINGIKVDTIDDLRRANISLEKKLNEASISFEKENNSLQCKLKETECKVMCQEQQIKSLSAQIDRLLEQDKTLGNDNTTSPLVLMDEIEALHDQLKNLKDALCFNEEEKQQLQEQFGEKLNVINELKMEIEDWKSTYEKLVQRNEYLEDAENLRDEVQRLLEENRNLSQEVEEKTRAVGNLMNVIQNKSQELNRLMEDIDTKEKENGELYKQLHDVQESYDTGVMELLNEKEHAISSLQLARQESQELLHKMKNYDEVVHKKEEMSISFAEQAHDYNKLKNDLIKTIEENKKLQMGIANREKNNSLLLQEIQRLREVNNYAVDNINNLQDEKNQYKLSLDLTRKESLVLENKLLQFEELREKLHGLTESQEKLLLDKNRLERDLRYKANQLDNAIHSIQLTKKDSDDLIEKLRQSENIKEDFAKLNGDFQKLSDEKDSLKKELEARNRDLDNLLQNLHQLRIENDHLSQNSNNMIKLEKELENLKKNYDNLMENKAQLQKDFDNKTEEIGMLYGTLENKIRENNKIVEQIKYLEHNQMAAKTSISSLQNENFTTQTALDLARKESATLMDQVKSYEAQVIEFDKLKRAHDLIQQEKERMQEELNRKRADLKRAETENHELNIQSQNLLTHNEDLEKALINARNELITESPSQNLYADISKEIEDMKKEKLSNYKKIRDLLDKLDESENIISNLSEDVMARDDKIAILENHINSLEDEVRRLHQNLSDVVDTGEQIREFSYQKIDQSLNKMEAHHSKAAHNMKIELAKLHSENAKLEIQLSTTKLKTEESFRDRHKIVSQVIHLQNEREIIVKEIQQLELSSVGDSKLIPECQIEDVLNSLDRIKKCVHAKNSKGNTLEQTIVKVQTSSQLLLSKADQAQKVLEKEKQKIINEKEEAVADRLNMEKQLGDLKQQLEKQKTRDKGVIKNLEAEILNQKLIIDKINQSRQNYISKLEEEMRNLQDMYKNSTDNVTKLEEKFKNVSQENSKNVNLIENITQSLKEKSDEVSSLLQNLEQLKQQLNKTVSNVKVQASLSLKFNNESTQTDKEISFEYDRYEEPFNGINTNIDDTKDSHKDVNLIKLKTPHQESNSIMSGLIPKPEPKSFNEVQILTANLEPTFDFVKNCYLRYKLKCLSVGRLEQYAISSEDGDEEVSQKSGQTFTESTPRNPHLVDIYNRKSVHSVSSNVDNLDAEHTITTPQGPQSATKSSGITELALTNDIFDFNSTENISKYRDSNMFIASTSCIDKSPDNDLFLIYKDSEISHADKGLDDKDQWQKTNRQPKIRVETIAMQPLHKKRNKIVPEKETVSSFYEEGNLKHKINIQIPRVEKDSYSMLTLSDSDNLAIYSKPKRGEYVRKDTVGVEKANRDKFRNIDSKIDVPDQRTKHDFKQDEDISKSAGKGSHHKLSRVDANFVLLRGEQRKSAKDADNDNILQIQEPSVFGLNYILNTVQREIDPDNTSSKDVRKSRSDEYTNLLKFGTNVSTSFRNTTSNISSGESKYVTDQSIMVKTDGTKELENQIYILTKALQNIEKDYKTKNEAIKMQYDSNIKSIINEHNQGVKSIQNLHEETLQDIIKIHENEVENLRSLSIEAMRKADKLEKENRQLRSRVQASCTCTLEEPKNITSLDIKKRKMKLRSDTKMLTKTIVEAFNVKPKMRSHGPCTCSLDINISDTIRNIFEQVDVEQRKLAEHAYLKFIANKIMNSNVESLDAQELSFLHLKVCRTWKTKLSKEEVLQKKIDSLEIELMNKQRHAQQHIAELDRKVAEERRRLQEVREAVCCSTSSGASPGPGPGPAERRELPPPAPPPTLADRELLCHCKTGSFVSERRSAGDLLPLFLDGGKRHPVKRGKTENNRAVLAKLDVEERREKKLYNDEPPTRLRRDRPQLRSKK